MAAAILGWPEPACGPGGWPRWTTPACDPSWFGSGPQAPVWWPAAWVHLQNHLPSVLLTAPQIGPAGAKGPGLRLCLPVMAGGRVAAQSRGRSWPARLAVPPESRRREVSGRPAARGPSMVAGARDLSGTPIGLATQLAPPGDVADRRIRFLQHM